MGADIIDGQLAADGRRWAAESFLCLLDDPRDHPEGDNDVAVVTSVLIDRLVFDEDEVGTSLIPIAALSFGDFVCLDYRASRTDPSIVVWVYADSKDLEPSTIPVSASFDEFIEQLIDVPVTEPGGGTPG